MWLSTPPGCGKKKSLIIAMLYGIIVACLGSLPGPSALYDGFKNGALLCRQRSGATVFERL